MKNTHKGFTLIEILVSIGIISILSGVLYASFGAAREDSRNKAFQTEIKEAQLAIELYKAQYGQYPYVDGNAIPGCVTNDGTASTSDSTSCGTVDYIAGLAPDFISELPTHTKSNNPGCAILYSVDEDDASWYKLTAANCVSGATSVSEGIGPDSQFGRCPTSCSSCTSSSLASTSADYYESLAVYSSGGECQ